MNNKDFSVRVLVNANASHAYKVINEVTKWWTENLTGDSAQMGDEFSVQFGDVHYSKQKLIELIPDEKVVWLVTEGSLNFVENKEEWVNTQILFELENVGDKTQITFTHKGLIPQIECYSACSNAWTEYIQDRLKEAIEN